MLGERESDTFVASEFADEYQDWLEGRPGSPRAQWFDLPVRRLAKATPLLFSPDTLVAEAVRHMADEHRGTVLVVRGDQLVGIFTERDLLRRVVAEGRDPSATPLETVMTEDPEVLPESATLAQAMRMLARARYRHVPVVDARRRPVAMLSTRHVIGFVSETFPKEILNAPPEGARPIPRREGA